MLRGNGRIEWAGSAQYSGLGDLGEVLARLAAEAGQQAQRACVALSDDVAQLRCVEPAPPLKATAARKHVALQGSRMFRNGHGPLVTDARIVTVAPGRRVLVAAAVPEHVVRAIVNGLEQAGVIIDSIGPAAEQLPLAVAPNGNSESLILPLQSGSLRMQISGNRAWRSRRSAEPADTPRWIPALADLGDRAPIFAAAFAATFAGPSLDLLPPDARTRAGQARHRRRRRLAIAAVLVWGIALATGLARAGIASRRAEADLAALAPRIERAAAARRELNLAAGAVAAIADAQARRSRHLELLADLTARLGDSMTLASLRIEDSTVNLSGYAPVADRVVAALERSPLLSAPRLTGPPSRQAIPFGGRILEWDRYTLKARLAARP